MADAIDPHAGLREKQVKDRAAAARELAANGSWSDVPELVRVAMTDKGPSVRLYAAAAAADIACRGRGVAGQVPMSAAQRDEVLSWLKGVDPVHNPAILMLLASSADPRNLERLGRALRDPRNVVRAGAAAALRRLALSSAAVDEPHIAAAVGEWLDSGKLAPDAILELARLVGEAGWWGFDERLKRASTAGRPHAAVVQEAVGRLAERADPAAWEGLWVDHGRDVFQNVDDQPVAWCLIADGRRVALRSEPEPLVITELAGSIGGRPARLIRAPHAGESSLALAMQTAGRTWWKRDGKDLVAAVDDLAAELLELGPAMRPVVEWLGVIEGAAAVRARAIALSLAGAHAEAVEALQALVDQKKPRNDVYWWLGRSAAAVGDAKRAKKALAEFLDKATKKAAWRAEAEALLASL